MKFRSQGDPVLFIKNPDGIDNSARREMLDTLKGLNQAAFESIGDPEIETRIGQYEMAYRMQASVPELMDLKGEPASTFIIIRAAFPSGSPAAASSPARSSARPTTSVTTSRATPCTSTT